jgi:hypothetical protein
MSEETYDDLTPPGVSARDMSPLEEDHLEQAGLNRRQSRTIPPARKWRMIGLSQRVCPECRAIVANIQDGHWHLQTAHNQGKGVDLEAWGQELRDELDEYVRAARGRRGLIGEHRERGGVESLARGLIYLMVAMALFFVMYLVIVR